MTDIAAALGAQADFCALLDSPLNAGLLREARDDYMRRGIVHTLLHDWAGDAKEDGLPLRLAGLVHYAALGGEPSLARFYASCGGQFTPALAPVLWQAVEAWLRANQTMAQVWCDSSVPQTNEVGRAAMLLGGFLEIAHRMPSPLWFYEIGASAGLNLNFVHYGYRLGEHHWGSAESALQLSCDWHGGPPALHASLRPDLCKGCDIAPMPIGTPDDCRRLSAWVWGDMPQRFANLQTALTIAQTHPPDVTQAQASNWLKQQLPQTPQRVVPVVFQSMLWAYLSSKERTAVMDILARYGASHPLAWLRMDVDDSYVDTIQLRLRLWQDGGVDDIHLARCHAHGKHLTWFA